MATPHIVQQTTAQNTTSIATIPYIQHGAFAPVTAAITQFTHHSERYLPLVRDYNAAMHLGHMASYREALRYAYGRRVLDIGCGVGYGSLFLASQGAKSVVAIDLGAEALAYADYVYPHLNLTYLQADGMALPFADESFDFIFSSQVIEHVPSAEIFMQEIKRLLAPNGFCLITAPNLELFSPTGVSDNEFHISEMDWNTYQGIARRVFPATCFRGIPQHCLYFNDELQAVITKPNSQIRLADYVAQDEHLEVCENMLCFGFKDPAGQLSSLLPEQNYPVVNQLEPLFWDLSQQQWVIMTRYPADERAAASLSVGQSVTETIVVDQPGFYRLECDVLAQGARLEATLCEVGSDTILSSWIQTVVGGDTIALFFAPQSSGSYQFKLRCCEGDQPLQFQTQPVESDQQLGCFIDGQPTGRSLAIRTFAHAS